MINYINTRLKGSSLFLIALVGLVSCTDSSTPDSDVGGVEGPESKTIIVHKETSEFPHLCETEYKCNRDEFDNYFKSRSSGTSNPLTNKKQVVSSTWLETLAQSVGLSGTQEAAIRIHYGLSGDRLIWGLEPIVLDPTIAPTLSADAKSDIFYDVTEPVNNITVINTGGTAGAVVAKNDWETSGAGKNYFSNMVVKRSRGGAIWDKVISGNDYRSYTFRWSDIEKLRQQNANSDVLQLVAITTPEIRFEPTSGTPIEDNWHHEVAIVVDENGLSRNPVDPQCTSNCLANRALNLGSPCPPSCKLARFFKVGLIARSSCKCK